MSESDSKQAQPESSVDDRALERLRIDLGRAFDWHFNRLLSELGTLVTFVIVIAATLFAGFLGLGIVLYKGLNR